MALATRCPHCHTTFRVVQDQLKLRAGLVRCGACKEIFNGIEHLLRLDTSAPTAAPVTQDKHQDNVLPDNASGTTAEKTSAPTEVDSATIAPDVPDTQAIDAKENAEPAAPDDVADFLELLKPTKASSTPSSIQPDNDSTLSANTSGNGPFLRMTLMDFSSREADTDDGVAQGPVGGITSNESSAADAKETDTPDPIADAIDELQRKPLRHPNAQLDQVDALDTDELDTSESEEPSFVKHGRRKQQFGAIMRILMAIGSVILLIGLIAQGTYTFRSQIAAQLPQVQPILAKACLIIGCRLDLPTQIDAVSIESSELQTLAASKGLFALTTLLRNHSTTAQAWPSIELTLNDVNEKPLARRVFAPREYLPSTQSLAQGFGPTSEQSVKLFFEFSQLKPSGYRVYLFYP